MYICIDTQKKKIPHQPKTFMYSLYPTKARGIRTDQQPNFLGINYNRKKAMKIMQLEKKTKKTKNNLFGNCIRR